MLAKSFEEAKDYEQAAEIYDNLQIDILRANVRLLRLSTKLEFRKITFRTKTKPNERISRLLRGTVN